MKAPENHQLSTFPEPKNFATIQELVPFVQFEEDEKTTAIQAAQVSGDSDTWQLVAPAISIAISQANINKNHWKIKFGVRKTDTNTIYSLGAHSELNKSGEIYISVKHPKGGSHIDSLDTTWIWAETEEELQVKINAFHEHENAIAERFKKKPGNRVLTNELGGLDAHDTDTTINNLTRRLVIAHEFLKIDRDNASDLMKNNLVLPELFKLLEKEWIELWTSFCSISETAVIMGEEAMIDEEGQIISTLQELAQIKIRKFIETNASKIETFAAVWNNPEVAVKFFQTSNDPKLKPLKEQLGFSFGKR